MASTTLYVTTIHYFFFYNGDIGVFHVNDLYEEYAAFAAQKLIEYAVNKGYNSIIIEAVAGDYQLIDSKETLSPYGKLKYSTAHLKNPEVSLYHDRMDGNYFYASDKSRQQARVMLQDLANLSESGLCLFILYHDNFIPAEERTEFMEKNIFYHATDEWESVPYIFPEGNIIDKETGKVFHIWKGYAKVLYGCLFSKRLIPKIDEPLVTQEVYF